MLSQCVECSFPDCRQAFSASSIGLIVLSKSARRVFDLARNALTRLFGLCSWKERLDAGRRFMPYGTKPAGGHADLIVSPTFSWWRRG